MLKISHFFLLKSRFQEPIMFIKELSCQQFTWIEQRANWFALGINGFYDIWKIRCSEGIISQSATVFVPSLVFRKYVCLNLSK